MHHRLGRVGRGVFPPAQVAEVKALACELPAEQGVPLSRWSGAELAREAVKRGIVAVKLADLVELGVLAGDVGQPRERGDRYDRRTSAAGGDLDAGALEQAQEKLMDDARTSHPFYWSGFAIIGDGARPLVAEEYFTRVGQRLAQLLGDVTADGFSHRVDLRLRPFGNSGRIAMSFAAMEQYFQREGRDWERYAWIKARPVAGDINAGNGLLILKYSAIYGIAAAGGGGAPRSAVVAGVCQPAPSRASPHRSTPARRGSC